MRDRLLVVDLNNQVWRATSSHQGLTSGSTFTGGLYGFLISLCVAIKENKITRVVVGTDSKPYLRSEEYPAYKTLRKKDKDPEQAELMFAAFSQSLGLVKELCRICGFPIWEVPGFEYDDLVAHVVRKYGHRLDAVVALSNDSDIAQLLDNQHFSIYKGKQKGSYRLKEFREEFPGIEPRDMPLMLAMAGTHNDIQGIFKVGPVAAIKAILDPARMQALRSKHAAIIDRNLPLIRLPHPKFPRELRIPGHEKQLAQRDLYKFFGRYDIELTKYILDSLEAVQP